MNKTEIINMFKKAKYDDLSCEILGNSMFEFQKLFKEKYISTENAIKQICKNIKNGIVLYDTNNGDFDATCAISTSEFKVNKEVMKDEGYFKYVLFHEMLHAISYKNFPKHDLFMGFYSSKNGEGYSYKSKPFNEAFTEYLTLKRNKMVGFNREVGALSGYDMGAQKIEILTKVIPEEELIDAYFNHPYNLEKIFKKYNMDMEDIFYTVFLLQGKQKSQKMLEQKRGLDDPNDAIKIIEANRIMLFNISDSLGKATKYSEFKKKWAILFSEREMKYNFIYTDGIGYFMEFFFDLFDLNLKNEQIDKLLKELNIKKTIFNKYKKLYLIFGKENKYEILQGLAKIYNKDYNKYYEIMKDDAAPLCYRFFKEIPNNYFLYDIEIYPRIEKYIDQNDDFEKIKIQKIICEEAKIVFYVFIIGKDRIIECTYDNVFVEIEEKNKYKVVYDDDSYNYIVYEKGKYYFDMPNGKIEFKYIYK